MKFPYFLIPLAAASVLMAQTLVPKASNEAPPSGVQHSAKARNESFVQRMTERLNLTPDQQNRVKTIFKESREQSKDLRMKMREEHQELSKAVRNDSEAQIDRITRQNADVIARLQAIHEKAMAKVYSILTPEQKAKFDNAATWRSNRVRGQRAS